MKIGEFRKQIQNDFEHMIGFDVSELHYDYEGLDEYLVKKLPDLYLDFNGVRIIGCKKPLFFCKFEYKKDGRSKYLKKGKITGISFKINRDRYLKAINLTGWESEELQNDTELAADDLEISKYIQIMQIHDLHEQLAENNRTVKELSDRIQRIKINNASIESKIGFLTPNNPDIISFKIQKNPV